MMRSFAPLRMTGRKTEFAKSAGRIVFTIRPALCVFSLYFLSLPIIRRMTSLSVPRMPSRAMVLTARMVFSTP